MSTSRRPHLPHRGLRSRQRARSWWPMTETLAGKWVWVWNWRRCDGGDPAKIAAALKGEGRAAGGWASLYGRDPAGEARLIGETARTGADLFVLDVEAQFEGQPEAAEGLCHRVREAVGGAPP